MWKFLLALLFGCVLAISAKSCTITLPNDIVGMSPVILTKTSSQSAYSLFKPTGKVNTFTEGTLFLFVCTGSQNAINSLRVPTLDVKCSKEGKFVDSHNNVVVLNTLVCNTVPASAFRLTSTKCSNDKGLIYELGFMVGQIFYRVYEICYNKKSETTLYTHNTLNGAAVNIKITLEDKDKRPFQVMDTEADTRRVNGIYKNQLQRFEDYFGKTQTYVDGKKYLSRGHLTADADFIFGYEKLSTYYYENAAPQFQVINGGNWQLVEDKSRILATKYGEDIESYNGYFGVVELPKSSGEMVKVYLDEAKLYPIPKYYFKVLMRKSADESIVFVNVNNPYITDGKADEVCPNVCDRANWKIKDFAIPAKGYTFCCSLDEFKKVYKDLPSEVRGNNLLMQKK